MDGKGWRRLAQITNDDLEKFRVNFSRVANVDVKSTFVIAYHTVNRY